jgi:hypothetical protein
MYIELKYNIYENVYIIPLQSSGKIIRIVINSNGIFYEVRYFLEGKPESETFYEDEIKGINE